MQPHHYYYRFHDNARTQYGPDERLFVAPINTAILAGIGTWKTTIIQYLSFVKCVKGASSSVVSGSMGGLLPYMNEKTCKKAAEYFTGNELWDQGFPKHVKAYVDLCSGV